MRPRAERRIPPSRPIVVVAPHPDDEVIGFGGALFDHVRAGGRVAVLSITDGEAYDPTATAKQRATAAARRRDEQLEALGVLGIDARELVRLGAPDGAVADHVETVADVLRGVLRSFEPDEDPILVAPWREDLHPDHVATSRAVRSIGGLELLETPIWSWHRRHELAPRWSELMAVPISSAAVEAKRAALASHRSQLGPLPGRRRPILSAAFLADFDRPAELVVR